jgi:hypothetical protein
MSYLSSATHQQIISGPAIIETLYNELWSSFAGTLGPVDNTESLSNALLATAFASIIAWDLKPYGPEPTNGADLQTLLNAPSLACDDYCRLTWYFAQLLQQTQGVTITAVGWNGGAVGNHAQLLATDGTDNLLLDPTIGLVARGVTYDSLLHGEAPSALVCLGGTFNEYPGSYPAFTNEVLSALQNGNYQPSDALYYVKTQTLFNCLPAESYWLTPQAKV